MRYVQAVIVVVAVLVFCAALSADEVKMKNGEVLRGKVVQLLGGKMRFSSETLGEVSVPLDKVDTFFTTEPIKIHFADDTVFNLPVKSSGSGMILVEAGLEKTPLKLPISEIAKINPPTAKWSGNISLGASATRGNSYTQGANAAFEAVRRGDNDRFRFDGGYSGARQKDPDTDENVTTKRESYLGLQFDYFFSEKLFGYAKTRAERNAIAGIDLRFLSGVGGGWQFFDDDDFKLSTEAGLSWVSENYRDDPDTGENVDSEEYWSGRVAYHVDKKFGSLVSLFHNTEWYPGFEHEGGHFVKADAGLRSSLTESMFAEFKVLWDWDSTPAEGAERTDVTYMLNLGWTF